LSEKEATMNTVADTRTYAEILRDIPAFSRCAHDVLDHFVTESAFTMHTAAGQEICSRTDTNRSLYVVVAGSALLDAGDVRVALEPGDYFGGTSGNPRHRLFASVVAEEDTETLVISPEEVARLQHAASRRRHPSNVDWIPETATPSLRLVRPRRRMAVLERSAS
jgi:CRP-like cAMP-binding protein